MFSSINTASHAAGSMAQYTALALRLMTAMLATTAFGAHAQTTPHWDYKSQHGGPTHWAELDPKFESCGKGGSQSPIDIRNAVKADLPALNVSYDAAEPTFVNNGHTIQVNLPPGRKLAVAAKQYELQQFHFHTPSEEAINGKRTAMVAHFVHKSAEGELSVIAVLIQPGKTNAPFAPVFEHLPREGERITVEGLKLDLSALLPADKGYYSFAGSLTTPPCSEGVNWMVLKNPIQLGPEQIKAFRRVFNANARPLQATNGRVIKESM